MKLCSVLALVLLAIPRFAVADVKNDKMGDGRMVSLALFTNAGPDKYFLSLHARLLPNVPPSYFMGVSRSSRKAIGLKSATVYVGTKHIMLSPEETRDEGDGILTEPALTDL